MHGPDEDNHCALPMGAWGGGELYNKRRIVGGCTFITRCTRCCFLDGNLCPIEFVNYSKIILTINDEVLYEGTDEEI